MIFACDLGNPEAPVVLSDGSLVLVEMHPDRGCITHISADGKERRDIAKTGRPNGLALDKEGALWVAESLDPPSYPGSVNQDLAERGRIVFEDHCSDCHGRYGEVASYPHERIELEQLGTDPVRLLGTRSAGVIGGHD